MRRIFLSILALLALVSLCLAQTELFSVDVPRVPVWNFEAIDRGPVVGDLTRDGLPEIAVVASSEGSATRDEILIFNADNTSSPLFTLISDDLPAGYQINGTPVIADIDGDGWNELTVSAWIEESVDGNDGNCTNTPAPTLRAQRWSSWLCTWTFVDNVTQPTPHPSTVGDYMKLTTPAVADVTGPNLHTPDGVNDLIFVAPTIIGRHHNDTENWDIPWQSYIVSVFRWTGNGWIMDFSNAESHFVCSSLYDDDPIFYGDEAIPAVGDIDQDGQPDIVALLPTGNGHATLKVYRSLTGNQQDMSRTELTGKFLVNGTFDDSHVFEPIFAPVLCDYDHDGQLECVFPVRVNADGSGSEQIVKVKFTGIQPTQIAYTDLPTGTSTLGQSALAVSDEGDNFDHRLGAFVSAYGDNDNSVNFHWLDPGGQPPYWQSGNPATSWPKPVSENEAWWEHGYAPAIFRTWSATNPNDLELLTPTGHASESTNRVRHFRLDNTYGSDPQPLTVAGQRQVNQRNLSASTVADLNGDGTAELVTMVSTSFTEGRIYALEVGNYDPEQIEWNGYQNGPKHTGLYAQPVSGTIPAYDARTWSDRVTVYGNYIVSAYATLHIQPGTVVEFRPGASLTVNGYLYATGADNDSIYFKPDGTANWQGISLVNAMIATLDHCVIHGADEAVFVQNGGNIHVEHCRIYNCYNGVDAYRARTSSVAFEYNNIAACDYGILGTLSAGTFRFNTVHECNRAGIYWYGDNAATTEGPYFYLNTIIDNGVGTSPVAGGYFNSTTAKLECNTFEDNLVNQLQCDNHGDIVMNAGYVHPGYNTLHKKDTELWCGACDRLCVCVAPPGGFAPLMLIKHSSSPQLCSGYNNFIFVEKGTYLFDPDQRCVVTNQHNLKYNYFESNGLPDLNGPAPDVLTYCPYGAFYGPLPNTGPLSCGANGAGVSGASALMYQAAATAEADSDYELAKNSFSELIATYPDSAEAHWATRGFLRTGLIEEVPFMQQHDSLFAVWQDELLSSDVRVAAQRDAVWALISGGDFDDAHTELNQFLVIGDEDSLWAEVTLELVALLEAEGPSIQSTGNVQPTHSRLTSFRERLHQLMGQATDAEVRAEAAIPKSKDLAVAYPNPFNSTVTIRYEILNAGNARLDIFNLLGQKLTTLVNDVRNPGTYSQQWNATDIPSGVYFYRFSTNQHVETHKLLLLK